MDSNTTVSPASRGQRPVISWARVGRSSSPDRYAWAGTVVPGASPGGSARSTVDARAVVVAENGTSAEVTTVRVSAVTDGASLPSMVPV